MVSALLEKDKGKHHAKLPNRDCRMAPEQDSFHQRRNLTTICFDLGVTWEMSDQRKPLVMLSRWHHDKEEGLNDCGAACSTY